MYGCDNCGREFKSKAGLSKHSKSCEAIEEVVDESVEVEERQEVVVSTPNKGKPSIGGDPARVDRKIKKLKDSYKSTWDAEQRHLIEMEIKELEKSL